MERIARPTAKKSRAGGKIWNGPEEKARRGERSSAIGQECVKKLVLWRPLLSSRSLFLLSFCEGADVAGLCLRLRGRKKTFKSLVLSDDQNRRSACCGEGGTARNMDRNLNLHDMNPVCSHWCGRILASLF